MVDAEISKALREVEQERIAEMLVQDLDTMTHRLSLADIHQDDDGD